MEPQAPQSPPEVKPAAPAAKGLEAAKEIWRKESARIRGELKAEAAPKPAAADHSDLENPENEAPAAPPKVEAKKPSMTAVEAELARKDRRLREQAELKKAELTKKEEEIAAKLGKLGDRDAFVALAKSDPATFADMLREELKVSDEELGQIAAVLHWMSQPEDKRPAKVRELSRARKAQVETKSEIQLAKEAAEKATKALDEYKAQQEASEVTKAADAQWGHYLDQMVSTIPDSAPLTRALHEDNPKEVRDGYKIITEMLLKEHEGDDEFMITPELLAEKSEAHLRKTFGWAARAASPNGDSTTKRTPSTGQKRSPDGLSNQAKASPMRPAGKKTEAERVEEAKAAWRAAQAAT